jgi:hypothetical protein
MRRVRLFSALAVLTLFAAPLVSPASAGSPQRHELVRLPNAIGAPLLFRGDGSGTGFQAPSVSTALSTALSVNGPSSRNPGGILSPSVQVAVGTAVSIGGNASAAALDRTGDR